MIGALYAIFFLSGVAALIFETLWFHQAGLAFGNSIWASSLVLSSFMIGLAIGNGLAARFADRLPRPVRSYAWLEGVIAISGLALVLGLPSLASALAVIFGPLAEQPLLLNFLRLLTAFLLMLIPATAMGATLPILMKALIERDSRFGAVLGRLYGCNALGAVLGAIAGELLLVEWLGIRGTGLAAAGCNGIAAVGGIAISRRLPRSRVSHARRSGPTSGLDARALFALAAALFSGGILLALEVIWFRFLQLFIAGTSLAFSFMLATVLAGIGTGGLIAGFWLQRRPSAHAQTPLVALLAGALCVAVYAAFRFAVDPYAAAIVQQPLHVAWLTFALTFPVSTLSGMLFTLLGSALNDRIAPEARAAGLLTLANTIGAGLGSLIAGFLLLPLLGMEASLRALAAAYALVALLALLANAERRAHGWQTPSAALLCGLALLLFPSGMISNHYLPLAIQRVARTGTWQISEIREGLTETAVYLRNVLHGRTHYHELMTNGYAMSGTAWGSRRYMKLYVYWPVAVAGPPRSALLISYGVGSTAKALTDTQSLERIDIVDISREILELNQIVYPDPAQHPLKDPRVRVHIEDGRHFLQTTGERFDLITGEPPPPKSAGVVNLYTREYFQLIYDRLEAGGVNTYWLPVHSMTENDAKAIIRGYCDVFSDCSLWGGWGLNWMLVGSREAKWTQSEESFSAQWRDPIVGNELRQLGFEFPEQLGALFMADSDGLRALSEGHAPLVDDFPKRLENELPDTDGTVATFAPWMDTDSARERFAESPLIRDMWPPALREGSGKHFEVQRLINTQSMILRNASAGERIAELDQLLRTSSARTPVIWSLGTTPDQLRMSDETLAQGVQVDPLLLSTLSTARAFADRDFAAAAGYLAEGLRRAPRTPAMLYYRVYALCADNQLPQAQSVATAARSWLPAADDDYWDFMQRRFDLSDPRTSRE